MFEAGQEITKAAALEATRKIPIADWEGHFHSTSSYGACVGVYADENLPGFEIEMDPWTGEIVRAELFVPGPDGEDGTGFKGPEVLALIREIREKVIASHNAGANLAEITAPRLERES